MPHFFIRRSSDLMSSPPHGAGRGDWTPTRDWTHSPYLDPDPCSDPEAASVRSHPSSHNSPDQALLPHSPPPQNRARAQTQRLQRRRNQFYYLNGLLVPVPPTRSSRSSSNSSSGGDNRSPPSHPPHQQPQYQHQQPASPDPNPPRAKPYLAAFATDAKRYSGERRESRKLQKEYPRPRDSFTVEIPGDADELGGGFGGGLGERDGGGGGGGGGARGAVLGVRRRMEKLRGLYRRGEKEAMVPSGLR